MSKKKKNKSKNRLLEVVADLKKTIISLKKEIIEGEQEQAKNSSIEERFLNIESRLTKLEEYGLKFPLDYDPFNPILPQVPTFPHPSERNKPWNNEWETID